MRHPEKTVRDRDLVIDSLGRVHQVIGSVHPPSRFYAILKYAPSKKETPWKMGFFSLKRMFREYSPLVASISNLHCMSFEYKSVFPCVVRESASKLIQAEEGVRRIISRTRDGLERDALYLLTNITELGIYSWDRLGITGSLLAGFHNPRISDIDLVIYGEKPPSEFGFEVGKPLEGRLLQEWVRRNSSKLGIHPAFLRKLYDRRRRFVYRGRLVSVIMVPPRYLSEQSLKDHFTVMGEYLGVVEAFVSGEQDTTGFSLSEYYYPHISIFRLEAALKGKRLRPGTMVRIISFESLFSGLSRFSRLYVRGKALYDRERDIVNLVVGVREEHTFALPLDNAGNPY